MGPRADGRRQRQGVQADVRRGVHDTQGPGSDQAHAGASGDRHQVGRCLGGRGEEHDPPHGLRRAGREGGVQCARGNGHDGEVDGIGDVLDALMGRCRPGRRLAHAHHRTGELMGHELVERSPGRIPGRALPRDHGHSRRGQEATYRAGVRSLLAVLDRRPRRLGGVEAELDLDDAVSELATGVESRPFEHRQHPAVVGQDLGDQTVETILPSGGDEVLEEDRGQAPTPVGLVGLERQLRLVAPPKVVEPADADEQVAVEGHERHGSAGFDRREMGHLGRGQARLGREVAVVEAFG